MPISTLTPRRSLEFDTLLQLRARDAAALSATGSSTGLAFRANAYDDFMVEIITAAHTGYVAGTAQWSIQVEVSASLSSGYQAVGRAVVPDGTAQRTQIAVSGQSAFMVLGAEPLFIRVTATKTGSPGNLSYGAFVSDYKYD